MLYSDLHVHSACSPDAEEPVSALCESAVKKGLSCLAVTDHCEIDAFYEEHYDMRVPQSYEVYREAAPQYRGRLELLMGIELGQATADPELARRVVEARPYDVVLGSMHALPGRPDFAFFQAGSEAPALFSEYLAQLRLLARQGGFDVLTHLTYPLRYINGEQGQHLKTEDYREGIEAVLREIIARGIALEVNTSGLRQKYGLTFPDPFCLGLYRSLGGTLLTFGSDAHASCDVGAGIEQGAELARAAGFTQHCVFRRRKPFFYNL